MLFVATVGEQNKRENGNNNNNGSAPVVVSSRWNPTPEQLRALEELYRRGTRTPSAEQIQHITAQLRRFGKIEGKNVFYWFQNHKARERQKRRRQMESSDTNNNNHPLQNNNHHRDFDSSSEKKELAASRTMVEVEQTKNWASSTNCTTLAEESVSMEREGGAGKAGVAECRADGWVQFEEGELQQRRNFMERNATWHMMMHHHSPCAAAAPPAPAPPVTHLINAPPPPPTSSSSLPLLLPLQPSKLINNNNNNNLSFFISSENNYNNTTLLHLTTTHSNEEDDDVLVDNSIINIHQNENQTLQLFPLRSGDDLHHHINGKGTEISASNDAITPNHHHFFEFLPLKNN
ncbi:hypothetical protein Ahy_A05g022810 [Arachis hypogaea]|uniref:Homeobox domain-containing protein n=1 Tax=Arachis hypogaea TaxID=3818 RepID=A0A445D1L4_ARAHY|nr:hypothetical protein Ahy_A05g022810 [Arachis hypogaea]